MPKNFLKKIMPHHDKVKSHESLKHFGEWLHKADVWHFNRRSASRAALVGLFFAFIPLPMQMLMAVPFCIWLRANLPLTIAFVWTTNPLTIPPIFYGTYLLGTMILGIPAHEPAFAANADWVWAKLVEIWEPLVLGSLIAGVAAAATGYTVIDFLWRRHTLHKWHARKKRPKSSSKPKS